MEEQLTNNFFGFNTNFVWFFGIVEDRNDPLRLGRCKVRVIGVHPADKTLVTTDELPWAMPISPIHSAGFAGIGHAPVGPIVGTHVFGFFADGHDAQIPFFIGTVHGGLGHTTVINQPTTANTTGLSIKAANTISPNNAVANTATNVYGSPRDYSAMGAGSVPTYSGPNEYIEKVRHFGPLLMQKFNLTAEQTSGILGNLAHESAGLIPNIIQKTAGDHIRGVKRGPPEAVQGDLGYGWGQWNKSRRDQLVSNAKANGYDTQSDIANYSHLVNELSGSYKSALNAVKGTTNVNDATKAFMDKYEKPNPKYAKLDNRITQANRAYNALIAINVPRRSTGKNAVPTVTNT